MSFWSVTATLLQGFVNTGKLFFLTLIFALPLGMLVCMGAKSGFAPLRSVVKAVIWVVRGSPLMLQILIVYYGPGLIFGLPLLPRFTAALVTFSINYACYFAEIYRGGLLSIPAGQWEAGQALGMGRGTVFFWVILPQMVKRVLPPMGNEFITLVKDTALVRVISVSEIIWMGETYIKKGLIWPLFYTAVFYLAASGLITLLLGRAEKKLSYYE